MSRKDSMGHPLCVYLCDVCGRSSLLTPSREESVIFSSILLPLLFIHQVLEQAPRISICLMILNFICLSYKVENVLKELGGLSIS